MSVRIAYRDFCTDIVNMNYLLPGLTLYHTIPPLKTLKKKPFENIVGKGENAGNQHYSFSHIVFYSSHSKFQSLIYIQIVVCKCFQFGQV